MRTYRIRITTFVSIFGLLLASALSMHAQGITTAAMSGFVTGTDDKPVAGATVTAVHEPSGTQSSTTTRSNGQYDISNLRVGGPYTVTVSGDSITTESQKDVQLGLGETEAVNFKLSAVEVVKLEAFKVSESRDATFGAGKISTGTSFNQEQVVNLPTIRRSIQDLVQIDSRVAVTSLDQGGNLSAQGQNFRFNSFLIDGVQANDPFGLNGNGFSSLRSPIPFEAIASVNLELNPMDVRRSGFTGALVNVVTKSGTNHFSGSSYVEYTDRNMRAKNPLTDVRESFRERTYGVAFGGPLVPNRLFFFIAYDDFRRQAAPPTPNLILDATQVQQIVNRATSFGYDPGIFSAVNVSQQKTYLAKLDWNISKNHRFSYTFRKNNGIEPSFPSFTSATTTSFSNYWYDQPRVTNSYTLQLLSTWSSNFRTEAYFSHTNYDGSPKNHGTAFPEVFIRNLTGTRIDTGATVTNGAVDLGTEFSRQLNVLTTKTTNGAISGEYSYGDHKFLAGSDYQKMEVVDKFVQAYYGSYTFNSLADWVAGTSTSSSSNLSRVVLAPGESIDHSFAVYPYTVVAGFLQDTWKPNQRLTVIAGVRLDYPYAPQAPTPIPTTPNYSEQQFQNAFGISSTTTNNGNYTIGPRAGFNLEFPTTRKTQLRGAAGLFQGSNPAVWLANPYQNRGVLARVSTAASVANPLVFSPTPALPSSTAAFPAAAVALVNVTDPNFKSPDSWKGNLAIDHTLPGGWIISAEAERIEVERGLTTKDLNLKPVGNTPDGRILYAGTPTATSSGSRGSSNSNLYTSTTNYQNAGFGDVMYLTNTKRGGGHDYTLSIKRPMKNNWATSLAWTRGNFTEVSPATSSVALSNYNGRAVFNPNEDVDSTSNTNIKDRIVATASYRIELVRNAPTTVSLIYQGRSGHPYSWVYYGDANGDGFTYNDLFYMPNGPTDPKVTWTNPAERDAFFAFAHNEGLDKYNGRVVPRNSEVSRWLQTFDLKFTQTVPVYKKVHTEFYLNFINFANFFSKRWGLQEEVPFSYKRAVASTTINASGQYVYGFNSTTLNTQPITANDTPISRWQIQTGARIKF